MVGGDRTMTESEWLTSDHSIEMLYYLWGKALKGKQVSERRLWLFGCGCCRRIWDLIPSEEARQAVLAVEEAAAGPGSIPEATVEPARHWAWGQGLHHFHPAKKAVRALLLPWHDPTTNPWEAVVEVASCAAAVVGLAALGLAEIWAPGPGASDDRWREFHQIQAGLGGGIMREKREQCHLVRCLFGSPFQSPPELALLETLNGSIVRLAQAAYQERLLPQGTLAPDRLGVLCDALEEASPTDAVLLGHLRSPVRHVRGCFALDAVLGKS